MMGVAYKADVSDTRETLALQFTILARRKGFDVQLKIAGSEHVPLRRIALEHRHRHRPVGVPLDPGGVYDVPVEGSVDAEVEVQQAVLALERPIVPARELREDDVLVVPEVDVQLVSGGRERATG